LKLKRVTQRVAIVLLASFHFQNATGSLFATGAFNCRTTIVLSPYMAFFAVKKKKKVSDFKRNATTENHTF